jgi:hypothetical protein
MKFADETSGRLLTTVTDFLRSLLRHFERNLIPLICAVVGLIYYSILITDARPGVRSLFGAVYMGQTFNSMLSHLLHGQFDVDPAAIGVEAFVRDGKTYAYFGIFAAILRLPLLVVGKLSQVDITIPSCVLASGIAVYFKTATILALRQTFGAQRLKSRLFWALILAVVFGGPQVQFLKPSLYQEVINWAAAIAAAYIYCAVYGLAIRRNFSTPLILCMSFLAGLELLNRVSTGLGLCVSTALLLMIVAWQSRAPIESTRSPGAGWLKGTGSEFAKSLIEPRLIGAAAILLASGLICCGVNYGRWGNPFVIMPNLLRVDYDPARVARLNEYGYFNIRRLWFGVLYYLLPIWTIIKANGQFLFQPFQTRLIDELELPPSSLFVSDPLLIILAGCFFWIAFKYKKCGLLNSQRVAAVLIGLTIPIWIVCATIYLAFRYRVEFYPFLELSGFLGLYAILYDSSGTRDRIFEAINSYAPYLAAAQIVSSHVLLLMYKISPFGFRSDRVLSEGWLQFYSVAFTNWLQHRLTT